MGVPTGHPFFGNQYVKGDYILGTFKYKVIAKPGIEKLINASSKLRQSDAHIAKPQKLDNFLFKKLGSKGLSVDMIITGVSLAISLLLSTKLLRKEEMTNQDSLQSIELQNVGTCTYCREPLISGAYVPACEGDGHYAYIICKKCGEKNFARYSDKKDSATAFVNQ